MAPKWPRAATGQGPEHEYLRTLYSPSGFHHAVDGVDHRVRSLCLSACFRSRLCRAVDFPTISVSATLPGASPETMAASVASPIERQLSTIAGISSMTSSSSLGSTQITVQFDLNRNIDGAALDVQTALSVAARRLPIEMTTPPSFRKVNPGDSPILFISLRSRHAAAVQDQRIRRDHHRAADFAIGRRRAGAGLWRAEIRRPCAGRSGRRGRAQHLARRCPHRRRQGQFQRAGRHAFRPEPEHHAGRDQRDGARRRLSRRRRRVSQRPADQAERDRARHRRASKTTRSRPGSTARARS